MRRGAAVAEAVPAAAHRERQSPGISPATVAGAAHPAMTERAAMAPLTRDEALKSQAAKGPTARARSPVAAAEVKATVEPEAGPVVAAAEEAARERNRD